MNSFDAWKIVSEIVSVILNILEKIWIKISSFLDNSNNLPNLIQGLGLGLLTILIPLAIATLNDVYKKRNDESIDFAALDLHVVLDNVFRIKKLLLYVFFIFIPLLFWEKSTAYLRLIELTISLFAVYIIFNVILIIYDWIKDNKFKYRIFFLKDLLNPYNELLAVWMSVWQSKINTEKEENDYFNIFSDKINILFSINTSETKQIILSLLNRYIVNLEKRSFFPIINDNNYLKTFLGWHFKLSKERDYSLFRIISNIIENIEKRAIYDFKGIFFYTFIDTLKKHINSVKDDKKYLEKIFRSFLPIFFDNITNIHDEDFIWASHFPSEWKITVVNWKNEESSTIVKIIWDEYRLWIYNRIRIQKNDFDQILDNVNRNLFPEVEPITWATVLSFLYYYSKGESRVKAYIEQERTFGFTGRISTSTFVNEEEMLERIDQEYDEQRFKTIELTCILFKFTQKSLKKYITELNELVIIYVNKPDKELRRKNLKQLFEEMLEYLIRDEE